VVGSSVICFDDEQPTKITAAANKQMNFWGLLSTDWEYIILPFMD
jgi:hypothetical protein